MKDVLGEAILDYHNQKDQGKLWIHNKYGKKEEMPVSVYFRNLSGMPQLEVVALQQCRGRVLDIGAGAGSHALWLQEKGLEVTALDMSVKANEVMKLRGVKNIVHEDIFTFNKQRFDTLLLLMNGLGLTGTIQGLSQFLKHARTLLHSGGQLIFDSSDVAYLYNGLIPDMDEYYGEISYCYEYKKQKSGWFRWLYIDKEKLIATASKEGWETEILFEDEYDQYLAKLTR